MEKYDTKLNGMFVLNLNKDEKKVFEGMRTSMELMLELLHSTEDKNLKIVGADTIRKNYSEKSTFSIFVPAKKKSHKDMPWESLGKLWKP